MSDVQHYMNDLLDRAKAAEAEAQRLQSFVDQVVGRRLFSWAQIVDAAEKVNRGRS